MLAVRSNISRGNRTLRQKALRNHNLEEQAQALYKSWFVDFEPFKNGKFIESELGLIPEGWKIGKINDVINLLSGFPFKSSDFQENGNYQLEQIVTCTGRYYNDIYKFKVKNNLYKKY